MGRHFENKFKYETVECEETNRSKYIRHQTKIHAKGQSMMGQFDLKNVNGGGNKNIIDIIDSSFNARQTRTPDDYKEEEEEDEEEEYYDNNNRHCGLHKVDHLISPALFAMGKTRKATGKRQQKYGAIHQQNHGYV